MSHRLLAVVLLLLAGAICPAGEAAAQPAAPRAVKRPAKLVPPPKWDRAVTETFFTDARERLGPEPAPDAAVVGNGAATSATIDASAPASAPPSTAWSSVITASTLEDEIKSQVQPIAAAVQTPTEFKGRGYKVAREEFTLLAVLFGVIGQYDGQVRWQKEAPSLRDSFGRAGMNCKVGTDNSFSEARVRSGDLAELVRGGSVETRPSEAEFTFAAIANRPPLMKRMERSLRERLDPWMSNSAEFRKNKDAIVHEAQLLLLLSRVIKTEGYEYADDANYRQYVDQLEQQCQEILAAARGDELQRAQSAAAQLNKTCDACHGDFRG